VFSVMAGLDVRPLIAMSQLSLSRPAFEKNSNFSNCQVMGGQLNSAVSVGRGIVKHWYVQSDEKFCVSLSRHSITMLG
jgi:hypothetical protein